MPDALNYFVRLENEGGIGLTLGPFEGQIEMESGEIRVGARRETVAYFRDDEEPGGWFILPRHCPSREDRLRCFRRAKVWAEIKKPG
jgi:hypothetical protein